MRKWFAVAMIAFATLTISGVAEAGKDKKEKKAKDTGVGFEKIEIQTTDIADVDSLFAKAAVPIDKINAANESLDKGRKDLNAALGLSEDSELSAAITELATKGGPAIKMAMDGQTPKLDVDPSAGDDVKKGVEALNGLLKSATGAAKELATVPADFPPIIAEAKGFADLNKLKEIAAGTPPPTLLKAIGKIKKNIGALSKAPDAVKTLTETSTGMVSDVTNTFK